MPQFLTIWKMRQVLEPHWAASEKFWQVANRGNMLLRLVCRQLPTIHQIHCPSNGFWNLLQFKHCRRFHDNWEIVGKLWEINQPILKLSASCEKWTSQSPIMYIHLEIVGKLWKMNEPKSYYVHTYLEIVGKLWKLNEPSFIRGLLLVLFSYYSSSC